MKLINLVGAIENNKDKALFDFMRDQSESRVNEVVSIFIKSLIKNYQINDVSKRSTSDHRLFDFNDDSFGGFASLIYLVIFVGNILDTSSYRSFFDSYTVLLAQYLFREIRKGEFVENIWTVQETLGISDKFYDQMVDYFGSQKEVIVKAILNS